MLISNQLKDINQSRSDSVFEGHAYYKPLGNGKYQGNWQDSYGNQFPLSASFESSVLTALWGEPSTETGRTTYKLNDAGDVEIVDFVRTKAGELFNRAIVKRSER